MIRGNAMPTPSKPSLLQQLVGHLAMGGALGAILAAVILIADLGRVSTMIVASADPSGSLLVFGAALTATCAVGSTFTGFLFIMSEER